VQNLTEQPEAPVSSEEERLLMQEWEQHMHDFVPEDITTVIVEPRREVTFYEDAGDEPKYIRGAYFVGKSSTGSKQIDFFIVSPKNKVIFSRRRAEEGIFRFNTTGPGRYSFIFSNIKDRKSTKDVTIAIHTPGQDSEMQMQKEDEQIF
jgi:emp24/gp25L/p24 family/GOLD